MTALTPQEREALTHWGIRDVISARREPRGASNRAFLIETESGRFVLRAYRPMPLERIRWEHRIIRHAVANGIPTPLSITTNQGRSCLELDGRCYALLPYLTDLQIAREDISPAIARSMGIFLGEMETRLAAFPHGEAPRQPLVAFEAGYREKALSAVEELRQVISALPQNATDEQWALANIEGQRNYLRAQSHHLARKENIRLQLIHGDFQESNLFFSQGQVSAIIDWERARVAPWGWEIVRVFDLAFELNPALCRAFLDGYKTTALWHENELSLAASLYAEEMDCNTWLLRVIYREGNDRARRFLKPGGFRPFQEKWDELLSAVAIG